MSLSSYMAEREPIAELLFGPEDATPMSTDETTLKPWAEARGRLEEQAKYWLATARPDGRPHVMPVLAVWMDGALYVSSRPSSRKGKNLAHDPHCVITFATDALDVVVEGEAAKVTGDAKLNRVADAFASKYEWHFAVRDGVVYDESLPGPPVYGFYEVKPTRAFGYGPDGMTATRWRF